MKKNKELKVLFSNTIMLYIMQISGYIFPLLTFPYLTRVLGSDIYGIMVYVNAAIVYFQMFVDFGFLLSATKECSINRDNKKKLGEILGQVIESKLILSIIGLVILIMITVSIDSFSDKRAFMILSYLPVISSVFICDYLFRGLEIMSIITIRSLITKTLYMICVFVLIKSPSDYLLIPIIMTVSNIVVIIWSWRYILFNLNIMPKVVNISKVFESIKDSSMFFLSRIASTIYGASNTLILGFFYNNYDLGQYGAANNLVSSVKSLFGPVADSIYPYMMQKKNYKLVKVILIICIPLVLIGSSILFFGADVIINTICGDEYVKAIPIFKAMIPMIIMTLPTYLLGYPVLGPLGMMKEANLSIIYASIFHIIGILSLYLCDNISIISIVNLTCFTEFLVLLFRILYVNKGLKKVM
ncbi:oligosaccharide flippase family protein [Clostridium paraputrificum]|uniref:oligosaccharide flippase family protein n=1 Tax=Clostridium paraputrificum TaxID=29363 RepID=UPI00232AD1BA|nr:oligosaccharide flippase family protein [Clostridium paraputrificum]MDB2106221.1 oligosaccharide flippase family protein [Clostridium paraputrificum]MDB2112912.1 oligosaccharide flippase family protein [Clostridium paraputrificum]